MSRSWIRAALAAAFVSVIAPAAQAQLIADKLWIDVQAGSNGGRHDVVLSNESPRRYFITVEAAEILMPGTAEEARVKIENPEELGLLVSPNRMILEPGASRSLRIVSINEALEQDRIYRVRVTPTVGEIEANPAEGEERGINLVMLTAYDLLVTVRPGNPRAEIVAEKDPSALRLKNTGNSNTLLIDGTACHRSGGEEVCQRLEDRRLYAGSVISIPLPSPDATVRFRARDRVGARERDLTF